MFSYLRPDVISSLTTSIKFSIKTPNFFSLESFFFKPKKSNNFNAFLSIILYLLSTYINIINWSSLMRKLTCLVFVLESKLAYFSSYLYLNLPASSVSLKSLSEPLFEFSSSLESSYLTQDKSSSLVQYNFSSSFVHKSPS
ncbi:putative ORFan [Cotonvirus japonicus]|uniref:ORFan n=1 Tax=Cotonvirus japonicus TaxID=2811091 RepID=A0ABM7NRE7_9VIRU|nr:putative ORFan [Cotonvirus japonicus]BCS82666.1 putative ORFan [Cotonvirus japonicus]